MRAIFIFLIIAIFFLAGCTSIEVAKGVTKASQGIETAVNKLLKSPDEEKTEPKKIIEKKEIPKEEKIVIEKQEISKEQKKLSKIVKEQKEIATLNLLGKSIVELNQLIGKPRLIREDGNTKIIRFDSINCRLFIFMNSNLETSRVEYYELRNVEGDLIGRQKNIELCFKDLKPV